MNEKLKARLLERLPQIESRDKQMFPKVIERAAIRLEGGGERF